MADYQYSLLGSPMSLCRYDGPCCFRRNKDQMCTILNNTQFFDGKCHFRKERFNGPNLYDVERRKEADLCKDFGEAKAGLMTAT